MENEVWKDIPDYEGLYQVSNLGRIKSLNFNKTGKEKIMKPRTGNRYYMIALWKNGIRKDYLLHRIVAETFIPNTENKPFINHKDENCFNNSINNLMWCTHKENMNWGTRNERISKANKGKVIPKNIREKISKSNKGKKISEEQKEYLRKIRTGIKLTEEHKKKISISNKGKTAKKVNQYDLNGNFIKQWDCILDFYKSINKTKNNSSVSSCCKGKYKTAYGYKWKYADEELQKVN